MDILVTHLGAILEAWEKAGAKIHEIRSEERTGYIIVTENVTGIYKEVCEVLRGFSCRHYYTGTPSKYLRIIEHLKNGENEKAAKLFFS